MSSRRRIIAYEQPSDGTKRDYDELNIERNKAGSYWIHFAVRPSDRSATQGDKNRRKSGFLE